MLLIANIPGYWLRIFKYWVMFWFVKIIFIDYMLYYKTTIFDFKSQGSIYLFVFVILKQGLIMHQLESNSLWIQYWSSNPCSTSFAFEVHRLLLGANFFLFFVLYFVIFQGKSVHKTDEKHLIYRKKYRANYHVSW